MGVRIFANVAGAGAFARVAKELALAQAPVSRTISRPQTRMRTTLFHRKSRRRTLTSSGLATQ